MLVKKLRVARERKRELTGKCEGRKSTAEIAPEVIQEIKRLHRIKPGQKRITYQAIADRLNEAGYKTISGKCWTGYNVQKICQVLAYKGGVPLPTPHYYMASFPL